MAYWLMKSEPNVFSFDQMMAKTACNQAEEWTGVRNYATRNNMRAMQLGDEAFFYHSNIGKEIVGIIKMIGFARPDSTAELNAKSEVIWECVDVAGVRPLPKLVSLATVKATPSWLNSSWSSSLACRSPRSARNNGCCCARWTACEQPATQARKLPLESSHNTNLGGIRMSHFAPNWLAVILASVVAWAFGSGWYIVLAKQWVAYIGKKMEDIDRSNYAPYLWSVLCIFIFPPQWAAYSWAHWAAHICSVAKAG